jgi:hypothetical protein
LCGYRVFGWCASVAVGSKILSEIFDRDVRHFPAQGAAMDYAKLKGIDSASELARSGKFIFAIKLLERMNPEITREIAKAAVDSLGYGKASRPPKEVR